MKIGLRKPSLRKRISARTSLKRYVRHSLGLKAPRGWGWLTNPKKAAYNRIYHRTTFGIDDLFKSGKGRASKQRSTSWIGLLFGIGLILLLMKSCLP